MTDVKRGFNMTFGVIVALVVLGGCGIVALCVGCFFLAALNAPPNTDRVFQNALTPPSARATLPPLDTPAPPPPPVVLRGEGDSVTSFTSPHAGLARIESQSQGDGGHFAVWLLDPQGNKLELLANDISPYSGTKAVQLQPGAYNLEVTATGPWDITVNLP